MPNHKPAFALTLALALTLAMPLAAAATPAITASADAMGETAQSAAIAAGLVPESLQSDYSQAITRAEFCALAVALYEKVAGAPIAERKAFADTNDVNAEKAAAIGVTAGASADGTLFMPDAPLTREQAAAMATRLAAAAGAPITGHGQGAGYADAAEISDWAVGAVNQAQAAGIMGGVDENAFAPQDPCTRGLGIAIISKLFGMMASQGVNTPSDTVQREIVQREGFADIPITLGLGSEYPLDGILSMPDWDASDWHGSRDGNDDGSPLVPGIVLVHGSGPNDMDETIMANKPFRDIADYLAANGIAVIRYDKRTNAHAAKMAEAIGASVTVREEVIDDAILAAEYLRGVDGVDEDRVFLLGHSLGGMLAPRICAEDGGFAGLIALAGSPRSLLDISYDQNMALIDSMPESDGKAQALAQMATYGDQLQALAALSDDEAKATPMQGGASYYYYKEMDSHPVPGYLEDLQIPMLIMQGSADFQVYADKDYVLWQELLEGRKNATFKLYDGLNHLFMPTAGSGIAGIEKEYGTASHVDGQALADIAAWIKSQAARRVELRISSDSPTFT